MSLQSMLEEIASRTEAPEPQIVYWVEPQPVCSDCRDERVMLEGDICKHCKTEKERGYKVAYKMGRLANGFALDAGTVYHAVPSSTIDYGLGKALCGTPTGRRSAGWHKDRNHEVTCKACLKKIERMQS